MSHIEIISKTEKNRAKIKAILFDFDGTFSTLRYGWENVMEDMMLEMLSENAESEEYLVKRVKEYIDQSTGLQTYYQMEWLANAIHESSRFSGGKPDPWRLKAEYNSRLMKQVKKRVSSIKNNSANATDFLIKGSLEFLQALKNRNVDCYLASGTDHDDVVNEAEVLGLTMFFVEISGAPAAKVQCSKKAVLQQLVSNRKLDAAELAVIGDGKVEIMLGREIGASTLGVASDEARGCGVSSTKRNRLIKAGAHAIIGDYENVNNLMSWFDL